MADLEKWKFCCSLVLFYFSSTLFSSSFFFSDFFKLLNFELMISDLGSVLIMMTSRNGIIYNSICIERNESFEGKNQNSTGSQSQSKMFFFGPFFLCVLFFSIFSEGIYKSGKVARLFFHFFSFCLRLF